MSEKTGQMRTGVSRRHLVAGAAWSVPAVAIAGAAPAMAASLRKDPGINGWVLNSPSSEGSCRDGSRSHELRVNSDPNNPPSTSDGAPFGLYLYDTLPGDVVTNAKITYWIIGTQSGPSGSGNAVWTRNSGGSTCWLAPVKGTPQVKSDGLTYTPYVFNYNHSPSACAVNTNNPVNGRVWFQDFDYTASFRQTGSGLCDNITYWTQRHVDINGVTYTFERRNGTLGVYTGSLRSANTQSASGQLPS